MQINNIALLIEIASFDHLATEEVRDDEFYHLPDGFRTIPHPSE